MATTDLHCHVFPYDYYADHPVATLGLSLLAHQIAAMRGNTPNTLLFDNGDFLQGNPLGDYIADVKGLRTGHLHPMIAAMNVLRYDAATLGNHEFNYGVDFLTAAVSAAQFPVISANTLTTLGKTADEDSRFLPPFVLLDREITDLSGARHAIRIGVIGFLPPQITVWDRDHLEGRIFSRDIVPSAKALLPKMKAAGADLIVALCHSGIGLAVTNAEVENAAIPLAALPGIDVIITGHSHMVFPSAAFDGIEGVDTVAGTICGKPAVMAGCFGSHLGVIDLTLEKTGSRWTIGSAGAKALAIKPPTDEALQNCAPPGDPAVFAAADDDHRATLAHIRRPVGRSATALHSYFGVLPGNAALQLVAKAQRWHMEKILRNTVHARLPLLSATATFKMGGRGGPDHFTDVAPGDLALRHVSDLYVHPNAICAVKVTGAGLRDWLERSASVFNYIMPETPDQPLLNPDAPFSSFDVIDGVRYLIDLSQPARYGPHGEWLGHTSHRITDLTWRGEPVRRDAEFIVATNSYRASGGSGFPAVGGSTLIHSETTLSRDILLRYVIQNSPISVTAAATWQFRPLPRCSALFESSVKAEAHLNGLVGLNVEAAGHPAPGLTRFRIHF